MELVVQAATPAAPARHEPRAAAAAPGGCYEAGATVHSHASVGVDRVGTRGSAQGLQGQETTGSAQLPHMRSSPCIPTYAPPTIRLHGDVQRPTEEQDLAPAGFSALLVRLNERNRPLLQRILAECAAASPLSREFLQACVSVDAASEGGRRRQQELWAALGKQDRQRLKQVWLLAEGQQDAHAGRVQRAYSGPSGSALEAKLPGWSVSGTPAAPGCQPGAPQLLGAPGGKPVVVCVEALAPAPWPMEQAYRWIQNAPTPMGPAHHTAWGNLQIR